MVMTTVAMVAVTTAVTAVRVVAQARNQHVRSLARNHYAATSVVRQSVVRRRHHAATRLAVVASNKTYYNKQQSRLPCVAVGIVVSLFYML